MPNLWYIGHLQVTPNIIIAQIDQTHRKEGFWNSKNVTSIVYIHRERLGRMIDSSLRRSIILCIVIATCYAFNRQCPPQQGCSCISKINGDYEIHCPMNERSSFVVTVQQHDFIQTQCHNSPQWDSFNISELTSTDDIKDIFFQMCTLPTSLTLGEIVKKFGVRNVQKLVFQSFDDMSGTLNRKHLQGFPSLQRLILSSNGLTNLSSDLFADLPQLVWLDLRENRVRLSPGIFNYTPNLEVLELGNNMMENIEPRIFDPLKKLRLLNLWQNKTVELRSNGLKEVPADLFRGCLSLTNVSLQRNYIESLPEDLFKDLKNLSMLLLNFNELTSLPDEIFFDLSQLVKLDLSKNHLTSISSRLKSLDYLNMSENKLKEIEDMSFNFMPKLRIAVFSNNYLTFNTATSNPYWDDYGKKSPFYSCTALEELYLDRNNISEIFGDWMISTLYLRILDLQFNQITQLSVEDLQFVSNNIKVNLTHNQIKVINLAHVEEIAKYQKVPRDVLIFVEANPIKCDCSAYDFLRYLDKKLHPYVQNYFHIIPGHLTCQTPERLADVEVTNLKSKQLKCQISDPCPDRCTCWLIRDDETFLIDCSYKNLTSVPRNIKTLPSHNIELNFTGNELTRMLPLTEIGLDDVQISKLLLSNNNINKISVDELPLNMKVLELHNNNISRLNSDVLQFMKNTSLTELTLHGNPWTCDCDARDFLNFIQTKVIEIPDSLEITCENMDVPMVKMTATDLCSTNTLIIIVVSTTIAITGLIIGLLAALYYRYQREIKVWLYAHQLCLWLVTEDELDKDKLYDAFISYSHKDEDFVVNELVPQLESGPRPFKLCLHFRDWLAGEWIPTQIARSVQDSRRTIVVLSPNFLESVWGRMEFRAAHSQALSEGRARVILILYGEIGPTDDLDPELKAYLSMNTYVKWGDPWFWDKLRYALPHSPELIRNAIRRKIFAKHQPCIQISGEKKELIHTNNGPETPAASTPPADSLKIFISDEKEGNNKEHLGNLSPTDCSTKLILSTEELIKHNFDKVQCTTV
ncbi:Protein toll [Melipona quadrifasciata]|uniref:Protein toll n=1 Tax=Melipona quadrifasciata TaxID=166423 RepID=A0A0M8ZY10_9HYME|nr:Protein toll [Melipona quadrifasciata]